MSRFIPPCGEQMPPLLDREVWRLPRRISPALCRDQMGAEGLTPRLPSDDFDFEAFDR
ncbi:MAG: hypothetical protein ACOH2M_19380 [Cypionkella sp.]